MDYRISVIDFKYLTYILSAPTTMPCLDHARLLVELAFLVGTCSHTFVHITSIACEASKSISPRLLRWRSLCC